MNKESRLAYAEVDAILDLLEIEYVKKVPSKIRFFLKNEKDQDYIPEINKELSGISRETISLLTLLQINYWCENEEEKQNILNELSENDRIKEELRKKYDIDNLFKNRVTITSNEIKQQTDLTKYKEERFINRILNKIKSLFRRNRI